MSKGEGPHGYDAAKAFASPLVFLGGPEAEPRGNALRRLVEEATGGEPTEAETYTADAVPPREWIGAASMAPFLSPRRTIVVRNVGRAEPSDDEAKLDKSHPWVAAARALPPTALLILVADDEGGEESRVQRIQARAAQWQKAVTFAGGYVGWFKVDPKGLVSSLGEAAKQRGLKLSRTAVDALAEMVGGNYSLAIGELEKLRLYAGEGSEVREEDVRRVVTPDPAYNIYRLVDFVVQGQPGPALRQLRTLYGRHARIEGQTFSRLMPALRSQFSRLWQAKVCLDARCGFHNLTPAVAALLPRQNISSLADWQLRPLTRPATRVTFDQLTLAFEAIVDADAKIKGQRPAHSPHETVEAMVLRLCQVFAASPTAR